jgi:hypothetical protein
MSATAWACKQQRLDQDNNEKTTIDTPKSVFSCNINYTTSACREDAAARVAAKTEASIEALKTRLFTSLEAAELRRQALLEAEKERLRAGHELVLTRLVSGIVWRKAS